MRLANSASSGIRMSLAKRAMRAKRKPRRTKAAFLSVFKGLTAKCDSARPVLLEQEQGDNP